MKANRIAFLGVLLAVGLLMAQSDPNQSSDKHPSKNSKGDITFQGCISMTAGTYVLMQTDPGNSYRLEVAGPRKLDLEEHLGEQVEITGWESPSLSTSSDVLNRGAFPSSVTLHVTSIRTVQKRCTVAGAASAGNVASPVSVAQLEVSSTPSNAEIEIDGSFVGQTTSVVSIAAGRHQLVVKKNGYNAWEKNIVVIGGQININAELEIESK